MIRKAIRVEQGDHDNIEKLVFSILNEPLGNLIPEAWIRERIKEFYLNDTISENYIKIQVKSPDETDNKQIKAITHYANSIGKVAEVVIMLSGGWNKNTLEIGISIDIWLVDSQDTQDTDDMQTITL